jgi:putative alpha-1,2-mannosidase
MLLIKDHTVKIIPGENKIVGYSTRNSGAVPENFKNYFVIYIDKPFKNASTWHNKDIEDGKLEYTGDHAGAVISFKTAKGEAVNLRVASSFISIEQAELNLKRELGKESFEATKQKAKAYLEQYFKPAYG